MILDLNAKRAARAAQRGEPIQMQLGEETFTLVDELPIEIGDLAANNRIGEALKLMLADPADWDRLLACKPSFNDVLDVVEYFGTALGESVKSAESSMTTGPPSKRISGASTKTTSLRSVTDQAPSELSNSSA